MRKKLALLLAASLVSSVAVAGDREDLRREADLLRTDVRAKAGPTDAEVGDAESFGRNVKWLGLLQSGNVALLPDCTPAPGDPPLGPDDRCVTLNPAPAITNFDLPDIGRIKLPARASTSLLCHWLSPIAFYTLQNTTAAFQPNAQIRLQPYIVIENPVLADPSLIDPSTGLPFAGHLESSFAATYRDSMSMQPGDRQSRQWSESRTCIAGFISKKNLVEGYGLTDAQARNFFRSEMTLRFGLRGSATLVTNANVIYGLRVMGD
ncbi:MAG TPA: hypothetical protein VFL14_07505 [Xanthomonadales bacterium]|nr:hypothetical protein [Xanthomonadales bacterium]